LYRSFRWGRDDPAGWGTSYFDVIHQDMNGAVKRRRYVRGEDEAPIPPNNERTGQLLWELPTDPTFYG